MVLFVKNVSLLKGGVMCILVLAGACSAGQVSAQSDKVPPCCAGGVANYKGVPFMTSKGPVTASIPNAMVA